MLVIIAAEDKARIDSVRQSSDVASAVLKGSVLDLGMTQWVRNQDFPESARVSRSMLLRQEWRLRRIAVSGGDPAARPLWTLLSVPSRGITKRSSGPDPLHVLARQVCVTYKHTIAWHLFAQSEDPWLLVLEDDAQLAANGESALQGIADASLDPDFQGAILGDVCEWSDTLGARLPFFETPLGSGVRRLVGNGMVAYLWRRDLALEILRVLATYPARTFLPIDWLVAGLSQTIGEFPNGGWMLNPDDKPFTHGAFESLTQRS